MSDKVERLLIELERQLMANKAELDACAYELFEIGNAMWGSRNKARVRAVQQRLHKVSVSICKD